MIKRDCDADHVGNQATFVPSRSMSVEFWQDAALSAFEKPVWKLVDTAYVCCGLTVCSCKFHVAVESAAAAAVVLFTCTRHAVALTRKCVSWQKSINLFDV